MRRNCNLELQLLPPSDNLLSSDYKSSNDQFLNKNEGPKQEQKELTIFYNGKMVSCDVTELQARAIILHARRENENEEITKSKSTSSYSTSPLMQMQMQQQQQQLYAPLTSLSMKKSLQQFLNKRKYRMLSASPYNLNHNHNHHH